MAHVSCRARILKKIDSRITRYRNKLFMRSVRRWSIFLRYKRHKILSHRYYKRPSYGPTYRPKEDSLNCRGLFEQRKKDHHVDFRMTRTEMDDLVDLFGGDEVFARRGKKPQAPARYQLGLLVYRLASGAAIHPISKKFGISLGTVHKWTTRALVAILRQSKTHIQWPNARRRHLSKSFTLAPHGVPHVIGFVDGSNINLERVPSRGKIAGTFHSRKERYRFNVVAVCDHTKRFTYMHWGFSARSSDMRVQQAMRIHTHPAKFFDPGEVLLADSGFTCSDHIIPMYRRRAGQETLEPRRKWYNCLAATPRVAIEHAFGILKGRWQLLRNARLRIMSEQDEAIAHGLIQAAFILHNLLLATYPMFVTQEDIEEIMREEVIMRERTITVEGNYEELAGNHQRREFLVDACIEYSKESEDVIEGLLYR